MSRTFAFVLALTSCSGPVYAADPAAQPASAAESAPRQPVFSHAVVAADHPLASRAGLEILRKGGNVVDAAAAVSFALTVVRPASCGLGGGGFMVIWNAKKGKAVALDYRERAPKNATRDMFSSPDDPKKANGDLSRKGPLAVAVPGNVAGLCYAVEHYGSLDLKTVMAPAIRLARQGVLLDEYTRDSQKLHLLAFAAIPGYRQRFGTLYERYLNNGKLWRPDDRFVSPQLRALELIAAQGADGFYRGPVAEAIAAECRKGGGRLTLDDLASTRPVVRRPLQGKFDQYAVLTMPPPSSGGVALLEILNVLSAYEKQHPDKTLNDLGHNSPEYVHLLTEAMKHAFADRAEFLGDADFADVPVKRLTGRDYAKHLSGKIDLRKTKPLKEYGRFLPVNDSGTSHFSIIDAAGNAVACTETINTGFGSYVVEPKFGIVLNNQMDDFAAVPGRPNAFGLIQSEANAVAPGKKPLSSMSPTIVLKDGKAVHVLGASGGPRIISSTLQVLLNLTRFGMSPRDAVEKPRFHHQWLPNTLYVEQPLLDTVRKVMEQRGHVVQKRNKLAVTQAASRNERELQGAADPRKHGRAAGY